MKLLKIMMIIFKKYNTSRIKNYCNDNYNNNDICMMLVIGDDACNSENN